MLKFNRTEKSTTLIDECIFRVFHNQDRWESDSFTTQEQESSIELVMTYGIFPKFQNKVLTPTFQKQVWKYLKKHNLGYGDIMPDLRELFYDYQEGIKFSTKHFLVS